MKIGKSIEIGKDKNPVIVAGPCVIESKENLLEIASKLKSFCEEKGFQFIFKSSYDKANRSSIGSYRGPGLKKGLGMLREIKDELNVAITTDVHTVEEMESAKEVVDLIQIPALLCRQTDLIVAASKTGLPVNIKKGQFISPFEVKNIVNKFTSAGNEDVIITERGTTFGYNNLVVDFRSFDEIHKLHVPAFFDVTHSLQLPGGQGSSSGGQIEYAKTMTKAAVAAGVEGLFFEIHPDPCVALCDGANMVPLGEFAEYLDAINEITHQC